MSIGLLAYTILPVSLLISGWPICSVRRFPSRRRTDTSVARGAGAGGQDSYRVHVLLRRRTAVHHRRRAPASDSPPQRRTPRNIGALRRSHFGLGRYATVVLD